MHVVSFSYECLGRSVRGLSVAPYVSLPTTYECGENFTSDNELRHLLRCYDTISRVIAGIPKGKQRNSRLRLFIQTA